MRQRKKFFVSWTLLRFFAFGFPREMPGRNSRRRSLFRAGGALFRVACFSECRLDGVTWRDAPELPPVARDLQNVVLALAVSIVLGVALDTDAGLFAGRGATGAAHPAEGA